MSENIAYQNKDIASKVFAERFKDKSLRVYGLNVPKIVQVLPTNLPQISANELRIDNLFLLEDGTIAIIDYESKYKKENRNKYINYIARVLKQYELEGNLDITLRMIVIYTADVKREDVTSEHDLGAMTLTVESAFLSEINSEEVMKRLTEKVNQKAQLTDEELMEFIILPLTYREDERKRFAIKESFDLAKKIPDQDVMTFVLTGLVVFTDKVVDEALSAQIKEWIKMTQVGRLYEAEKEQLRVEMNEALVKEKAKSAEKDVVIAEKDSLIQKLQSQLEKLNK